MTLLLAFFVVLFAITSVDSDRYDAVLSALAARLGGGTAIEGGFESVGSALKGVAENSGFGGALQARRERRRWVLTGRDDIFFDEGRAELLTPARQFLSRVARVLAGKPVQVVVEGHTDDTDVRGGGFKNNWELSTARAAAVIVFLQEQGVAPERLSAVGFAQYRPKYPPIPENRARNRRVEIVVTPNP